jgi:hypothetical protein
MPLLKNTVSTLASIVTLQELINSVSSAIALLAFVAIIIHGTYIDGFKPSI